MAEPIYNPEIADCGMCHMRTHRRPMTARNPPWTLIWFPSALSDNRNGSDLRVHRVRNIKYLGEFFSFFV